MHFVYILQSVQNRKFYKGMTNDFERRLQEHINGESRSTKNMLPIKVIHVEVCVTQTEARKLEKYFKSGFGREIIKELAEN